MARQQRRLFKPKKVRRDALERRIAAFVRRLTDRGAFRVAEPDALDGHVRAVLDRAPRAELWRGLLVTALIAAYHLRRTGGAGLPDDAGVAVPWPALSAVFLGWCRFSMPLVGDRGRLTLGQMFHTEPAPPLCGRPVREPELASPPDAIAEDARKVYEAQGWTAGPEHLARDLGALNEIAQEAAKSKLGANWMALAALALVAAAHRHRELTLSPDAIAYAPWWTVRGAGGAFLAYVHGLLGKGERVSLDEAYHIEGPPTGERGRRPVTAYEREPREDRKRHLAVLVAVETKKTKAAAEVAARYRLSERTVRTALQPYGAAARHAAKGAQVPGRKR